MHRTKNREETIFERKRPRHRERGPRLYWVPNTTSRTPGEGEQDPRSYTNMDGKEEKQLYEKGRDPR